MSQRSRMSTLRGALLIAVTAMAVGTASADAALPDDRAYERITPNEVDGQAFGAMYGIKNDLAQWVYIGPHAPAEAGAGVVFRSTRSATGWKTVAVNVPPTPRALDLIPSPLFNRDLTAFAWRAAGTPDVRAADIWRSPVAGPPHRVGLSSQDGVLGVGGAHAVSDDGLSIALTTQTRLLGGDTRADGTGTQVYVYDEHDHPHLVGVRNDGMMIDSCGASVPNRQVGNVSFLTSDDLETVFFLSYGCDSPPHLYARKGLTQTVDVSPSRRSSPDPAGERERVFVAGTPDGAKVLFETTEQLVDADTNATLDLYQYDLTADTLKWISDWPTAEYVGAVRNSEDQSRIYFVAAGQIDGQGVVGQPNLFLRTSSGIRLVAVLDAGDGAVWQSTEAFRSAETTPDGRRLVFASRGAILASDTDQNLDLYGYDAVSGVVKKLSAGNEPIDIVAQFSMRAPSNSNYVSEDGEFGEFDTAEALDRQDGNGQIDAYRWRWSDNSTALISAGYGQDPFGIGAAFSHGVSPDGKDLYFETRSPLLPSDTNEQTDIYSARMDGGFPEERQATSCHDDACQGLPAKAPVLSGPLTSGSGEADEARPQTRGVLTVKAPNAAQRGAAVRTGRLNLSVSVNVPGTLRVAGRATLNGRRAGVGEVVRRVTRAGAVTLALPLSRAARSQLAKRGRLALAVTLRFSEARSARVLNVTLARGPRGK